MVRLIQIRELIPNLILLIYQILMFPFTVDDAFITFRVSENLARTGQFVWNIGDAPLEASSTILLTLILVPFVWAGMDLVLVSKIIGIVAGHVTLIVLCYNAKEVYSKEAAFIPALLLAIIPAFGVHCVSGMETSLYLMCIALLLWRYDKSLIERLVFAFLVALTRTEGSLIVITLLLLDVIYHRNKTSLRSSVIVALSIMGFQTLRVLYFGSLLSPPTAFKTVGLLSLHSVYTSVQFVIYFIFLFFMAGMALVRINELSLPTLRNLTIMAALIGVTWLWEPIMAYDFRFLFPALVPLVMLSTRFCVELIDIAKLARPKVIRDVHEIYATIWRFRYLLPILIVLLTPASRVITVHEVAIDYSQGLTNAHVAIGHYLRQNAPVNAIVAVGDAGAIPYYSGLRAIDTYGLLTPGVFNESGYNADFVFKFEPDYIVIISSDASELKPFITQEIALINHPDFAYYTSIGVYSFNSGYNLWLMMRTGP